MLKDAVEYLVGLVRDSNAERTLKIKLPYNGKPIEYDYKLVPTEYGTEVGEAVKPFRPDVLTVSTLTGFVAAIEHGVVEMPDVDGETLAVLIHIEDPHTVSVKTTLSDAYGRRDTLLTAKYQNPNSFSFDQYYEDLTKFIIALQASFVDDDALKYLIRVASSMKAGASVSTSDDGFSQTVELKTGEIKSGSVDIKPRIWLKPIRTFQEIEPVSSEFLIRFKQSGSGMPSIALFNVNGTQWRNDTMQAIRKYLDDVVGEIAILA